MYQLYKKLKFIKVKIKEWNANCFKYIFKEKARVEQELLDLYKIVIKRGMDPSLYDNEKNLKAEVELLAREECYWRQKSRDIWLKEGDKNTKLFHASTKIIRQVNKIKSILSSIGSNLVLDEDIGVEVVSFFKELLASRKTNKSLEDNVILNNIPTLIEEEHNKMLVAEFTLEEVKNVFLWLLKKPRAQMVSRPCSTKSFGISWAKMFFFP